MDTKLSKIHVLNFLITMWLAYVLLDDTKWSLTIFQRLVISFLFGMVYMVLIMIPYIGKVVQFLLSGLWVAIVMTIVPFKEWTNNNPIWLGGIALVLFLIFVQMHGQGTAAFRKKDEEGSCESWEDGIAASTDSSIPGTEKVSNYEGRYRAAKNEFEFIQKQIFGEVSAELINDINSGNNIIANIGSLFENPNIVMYPDEIQKLLLSISMLEQINISLRTEIYTKQSTNRDNNEEIDESLFRGCTDRESITKRYRQLMKTFHPDNQNGDNEMAQKIQRTYESLVK